MYSNDVSTSPTRRCLVPWFPRNSSVNPNEAVVKRIFEVPDAATGTFGVTYLLVATTLVSILYTLI